MPTGAQTRERLIDAAFELFSRQGFHAVGLDRILAEVSLSKQTFYNHFESRDDLILAVLHKRDQWERAEFAKAIHDLAGDDPREQLRRFFDVMDAWMNHPDFRGCIFLTATAEFPSPHDPAHQAAASHINALEDQLADLADRAGVAEPRGLAEQFMVLIEGAVLLRHTVGRPDAALTAGKIAEQLLERHFPADAELAAGV